MFGELVIILSRTKISTYNEDRLSLHLHVVLIVKFEWSYTSTQDTMAGILGILGRDTNSIFAVKQHARPCDGKSLSRLSTASNTPFGQ